MTLGGLAGMIAALAFVGLVVFICLNLSKLSQIMTDLQETVQRVNRTLDVVTKDVDNLSIEVEGLLNKANSLVDDVNGKLGKTDPLFVAIGELGVTVSDLNESTKKMTINLLEGIGNSTKRKSSPLDKFIQSSKVISKAGKSLTAREDVANPSPATEVGSVEGPSQVEDLTASQPVTETDVQVQAEKDRRREERLARRRERRQRRQRPDRHPVKSVNETSSSLAKYRQAQSSNTAGEIKIK
ncbi:DUF948 domain-containing protein [Hutsoniella sourekii]|uniref:DUF948 domain-containing protein n=1 Tax=Hutsoniella sourekii TaxID=87650 RepID=UPI0004B9AF3A|nr:DUF948 domain-containing protein [Hutsoniella sourekii]